jgi:hypothetical protein
LLDAIPLSLAHVAYGGELNGSGNVDFGNKSDLAPFLGSDVREKVLETGRSVLQPIAGQAEDAKSKIRRRGKQTFEKIKSTPMDRKHETPYERRMRELNAGKINTTPPNERTGMDVSGTVVPTSPTAPGRPQYPTTDHPDEPISPVQETNGPAHSSEDGIPLTRLSTNQSEIRERQIDAEAQVPRGEEDNDEQYYFALPGGPGVINQEEIDGNDPTAFFHPATKERQPILWLPKDDLGLCEYEIEMNTAAGVESSCRRAILNSKGKVRIFGPPPVHHTMAHVVDE